MALPRVRTTPVQLGLVVQSLRAEPHLGSFARDEVAAGLLELRGEERGERVEGGAREQRRRVVSPAGPRERYERAALVSELDHHLVEGERRADPVADRLEQDGHVVRLGQLRRDLEHPLEHPLVLRSRGHVLSDPDGEGRMPRARDECVQLGIGGPAAGLGLVDRHDAEERAARAAQRHEQRIVRQPGVGMVGGLDLGDEGAARNLIPVEASILHEVRAAALEARREQRHPRLAQRGLAEQHLQRLIGSHGGRGEHVIERGPVDVHDHGAIAERLADRPRHLPEHMLQVLVRAHRGRALEHGAEAADHRERAGIHHGRAPMRKQGNGEPDVPVTGACIGGRPGSL
jgi:hypothetical protein